MTERRKKHRTAAPPSSPPRRRLRARKKKLAADPKALAQGVFARVDPEQTAVDLLRGGDKRAKLRVWELLLSYLFGKPAQRVEATGPGGGPIRMIWDIPAPERERAEAERREQERKAKENKNRK